MARPPDDEGRRVIQAAPSTTPTTATAPEIGVIVAESPDGVSADLLTWARWVG